MSTLRVNTIQDASGGNNLSVPGAAKAWVNFNGTGTVAIRASLNVSSITDNGTGDYNINFATAMPNANYCCGQMALTQSTTNPNPFGLSARGAAASGVTEVTTTSIRVSSGGGGSGSFFDSAWLNLVVFA